MALRNPLRKRLDHGHRLLEKHQRHVSKIHERATRRREVVNSRLASLEDEHHVLEGLTDKLAPHTR